MNYKNHNNCDFNSSSSYSQNSSSSNNNLSLNRRKENERGDSKAVSSKNDKGSRGIRCHECESFKHYQAECATCLKRKKKSLTVTLSNDEAASDSDSEELGRALINIIIENELVKKGCSRWQKEPITCIHQQRTSFYATLDRDDLVKK